MNRKTGICLLMIALTCSSLAQTKKGSPNNPSQPEPEKTPPRVALNPNNLDFGEQVTKRASQSQRITVTNAGEKNLYINSAAIQGDNRQDFTIVKDTCTGASVDSQKSCIIDVSFTPAENGSRKTVLTLTDNAPDSPQSVPLSGRGINSVEVPPSRSPN